MQVPHNLLYALTCTLFAWLCRYVLLKGVNDSDEDAERLGEMLKHIRCAVNVIMYNTHEGAPFRPSESERVLQFRDSIRQAGKICTVRESKGDDEMAACGQLGSADRHRIPAKNILQLSGGSWALPV